MDGQPLLSEPRVIAVPSDRVWFDPRPIIAACQVRVTPVTLIAGSAVQLCNINPRRVALGLTYPVGATNSLTHAPWDDPTLYPYGNILPGVTAWYYLHVHLNLVTYAWYGRSGDTSIVRVTEVTRI